MTRALALAVLLVPVAAGAFSFNRTDSHHIVRWYDSNNTIDLELDADGPTRLRAADTQAEVRAAVDRSLASWNDISCNALTLRIAGTTTETGNIISDGIDARDGISRVVWIETADRFRYSSQVLGITSPVFFQDGTIFEADIALNGVDNNWAVYTNLADVPGGSTTGQAVDVESVVVHELGHLIGLGHVLDGGSMSDPPTMTPFVDPQLGTRSLADDDRAAACFLYRTSDVSTHSCENNSDCPAFIEKNSDDEEDDSQRSRCVNDLCNLIEEVPCGDGDLGDRCCTDNCKNSLTCLAVAPGQTSYCASSCSSSRPCPDGFTCAPLTGGGGACISDIVLGCGCDLNDNCTSSCACDSDCDRAPDPTDNGDGGDDGGGCSASQSVNSLALLALVLALKRRPTMGRSTPK